MTWVRVTKGNAVRYNRKQYSEGQEIDVSNPHELVEVGAVVIVERQQPDIIEPKKEEKEDIKPEPKKVEVKKSSKSRSKK